MEPYPYHLPASLRRIRFQPRRRRALKQVVEAKLGLYRARHLPG
jgi:hypothetical protein